MTEHISPQAHLYAAMSRAAQKIKRVSKSGRNEFHRYDYATEGDIVDQVRDALASEGVWVIPSVIEHKVEVIKNARGREEFLATVTLLCTWVHSSGATHCASWVGQGVDGGDKAYYKAYTGAIKYALLKTFLIPTGDDPERDDPAPEPVRQNGDERVSPTAKPTPVRVNVETPTRSAACERATSHVRAAIEGTQVNEGALWRLIAAQLGAGTPACMTDAHWDRLMAQLPPQRANAGHFLVRLTKEEEVLHAE